HLAAVGLLRAPVGLLDEGRVGARVVRAQRVEDGLDRCGRSLPAAAEAHEPGSHARAGDHRFAGDPGGPCRIFRHLLMIRPCARPAACEWAGDGQYRSIVSTSYPGSFARPPSSTSSSRTASPATSPPARSM